LYILAEKWFFVTFGDTWKKSIYFLDFGNET